MTNKSKYALIKVQRNKRGTKKMWLSKNFNTYGEATKFKADMIWKGYKVELYFITNGYCVEYKKLALIR